MRPRTRPYVDIYLDDREVKRLRKGYTVCKRIYIGEIKTDKGDIFVSIKSTHDRKATRQIEKLKAQIKLLKKGRK